MKGKGLVPLLIIALVLVGLVIWKRSSTPTRTIKEQVNLVSLLPEGVSSDDVGRLELYSGGNPEEKVVLVRDEGDAWRLASHFDAPVAETKITEYIEALDELQGEFRETAATDEALEAFDLTEDAAFHVVGYEEGADVPAFHVLVGKAADYRTVFLRVEDQQEIYVEDTNLRQLAGVYGDDPAAPPTATPWLDKGVLELDHEKITRLEITAPDKELVFEKQEVPQPEPAETPEGFEPPAPPAPEHKWTLVSGGPGGEFKESGLTSVLRKFANLTATDVVDPADKAQWALDPAQFRAVVSVEGQDDVVLEAGRPAGSTDGYVRVASGDGPHVYKLDSYSFNQLFPKGSQLFSLPTYSVAADSIERIEVTQPEGDFVVVQSDGTWAIETPQANLPAQTTTIDTVESVLTAWKPDDYADTAAGTGLENAERTVVFSTADETRTLLVGEPSKYFDGYYAKFEDDDQVLAMTKTDYQKIFVAPDNLYQLKLLELARTDVASVAVDRAEDAFAIADTDAGWAFIAGAEGTEVDEDKAEDLVNNLIALQASSIVLVANPNAGQATATIRITDREGTVRTLEVAPEQDQRYPVMVVEKNQRVWVDKADIEEILVPSADLAVQPEVTPEPEADAEPVEGDDEVVAPTTESTELDVPEVRLEIPAPPAE